MTSGMSGIKSYNLSDLMSREGPKNVPGKGPVCSLLVNPSDAMSQTQKILKKQQQIIRNTLTLGRSRYISTLTVQFIGQLPFEDEHTSEYPHSLSSKESELPNRDSFVQVYGKIQRIVTQSPIERALTS